MNHDLRLPSSLLRLLPRADLSEETLSELEDVVQPGPGGLGGLLLLVGKVKIIFSEGNLVKVNIIFFIVMVGIIVIMLVFVVRIRFILHHMFVLIVVIRIGNVLAGVSVGLQDFLV